MRGLAGPGAGVFLVYLEGMIDLLNGEVVVGKERMSVEQFGLGVGCI